MSAVSEPRTPRDVATGVSDTAAREMARRLITQEVQRGAAAPLSSGAVAPAPLAAVERVWVLVSTGMARWFGPYGSRALVSRALARAQALEPALAGVAVGSTDAPFLTGLSDCVRLHGEPAMTEGVVSMLANLVDMIGRLIGADLAGSLLEQSMAASTAAPVAGPDASGDTHPTATELT